MGKMESRPVRFERYGGTRECPRCKTQVWLFFWCPVSVGSEVEEQVCQECFDIHNGRERRATETIELGGTR